MVVPSHAPTLSLALFLSRSWLLQPVLRVLRLLLGLVAWPVLRVLRLLLGLLVSRLSWVAEWPVLRLLLGLVVS